MKKIILLIFICSLIFKFYSIEETITAFSIEKEEVYDNYYIKFNDCDLNTNNFIEKFSYFKNKDFKILEIIPFNNLNETYNFYSNDLNYILDKFKNKYINLMINDSKYVTNICIKEIKINTSNYNLDDFKNIIYFTY